MKVIKKGIAKKGWAKEFSCTGSGNGDGGCGAVLLVEKADLFHTSRSDYTGDTDYFITFRCCACGVLTDLKTGDCPLSAYSLPHYRSWCAARDIVPE